jgi:DNA modification methylase
VTYRIIEGDASEVLRSLEPGSVQTCITSPPYWGLRDYGTAAWDGGDSECSHRVGGQVEDNMARGAIVAGVRPGVDASTCLDCGATRIDSQLGLEPTPEQYVENLVSVFREVRRVLRDDGTVWLNLGDSYFGTGRGPSDLAEDRGFHTGVTRDGFPLKGVYRHDSLKSKDLVGIPWMVAFALRADGWWLRSDIIWNKPNPMPESVTDRPTRSHEYLFLLTKSARYFYDADAIREEMQQRGPWSPDSDKQGQTGMANEATSAGRRYTGFNARYTEAMENGTAPTARNKRSVWTVATQPFPGAHFATFPPKLIEPCVLAGSPPKCCGRCGAPWERVVESAGQPPEPEHRQPAKRLGPGQAGNVGAGNMGFRASRLSGQEMAAWKAENPDRTIGWRSTCDHDDDSGQALVLDPFAGAGTTGVVACRNNRDFVGIELNPEYAQMARNRIYDDGPLLNVEAVG